MGPQWPGSGLWAGQLLSSYGGARGLCKVGKPTAGSGHWEKEAERRTRQQQVGAGSAATVLCGRPTQSGGCQCHVLFSKPKDHGPFCVSFHALAQPQNSFPGSTPYLFSSISFTLPASVTVSCTVADFGFVFQPALYVGACLASGFMPNAQLLYRLDKYLSNISLLLLYKGWRGKV